jgi:hypothetical protein
MTSAEDRNDLVPAQEKLEWVTPKITLMGAEETEGKSAYSTTERYFLIPGGKIDYAPS